MGRSVDPPFWDIHTYTAISTYMDPIYFLQKPSFGWIHSSHPPRALGLRQVAEELWREAQQKREKRLQLADSAKMERLLQAGFGEESLFLGRPSRAA